MIKQYYDNNIDTNNTIAQQNSATEGLSGAMVLDAHVTLAHLMKGAKSAQSAAYLKLRVSGETLRRGLPFAAKGRIADSLFQTNQSGIEASLDEHVMQLIYYLESSLSLKALLSSTEFQKDAKAILKAVLVGEWVVPGWLVSGTGNYKACVTKFLKINESPTDSSHVLAATCRLLEMFGSFYGPMAYRPWQLQWQFELPTMISIPHIHPVSLREFANAHIAEWFSPATTESLKSWLERQGTLEVFILTHQRITPELVQELQLASTMRLQGELLERTAAGPSPPAAVRGPGGDSGGKGKGRGREGQAQPTASTEEKPGLPQRVLFTLAASKRYALYKSSVQTSSGRTR